MTVLKDSLPLPKREFKISKSLSLVVSLILLYLFVALGLPFLSHAIGFTEQHKLIIDEKIEAGAWFYIFVEVIRDIEPRFRDTLQFSPGAPMPEK